VNATTIGGAAAEKIVDFGHEANVDLIILSSHGRSGLSGWNVSSVVQKIILRSFVSLMIVRAYQPVPEKLGELVYRRILVPLDGSQRAECVLSTAVSLARDHGAQLFLVHVVRRPEMPRRTALTKDDEELAEKVVRRNHQEAELYLEDLSDRLAVRNSVHVLLDNDPAMALQQFAKDSETDLVILSAHGYTGKRRWPYGSVAASFIAYGTTPLLTIQDIPKEEAEPTWAEALAQEQKGH
jgi:nucleotide-binding universal stress UspA family protein